MKVIKNCIVCLGLMLSGLALTASADSNWQLRKDKEGIQVYTRSIEGSPYDAVKAITRVENLSLTSLVALLDDVEACDDWADRCVESTVFKRVSDTEAYVYTHNDLPFPVKDRDVLTHVVWTQNPDTREVVMSSRATTGLMDKVKGRLRLTDATTRWRFRPLPSGKIEVSNESHINPGSSLPGWVTNMLLIETPYETIKSFVAEARKPKYQRAEVSFVLAD
ncbi:hypothetical protein imdm_1685 [gamma proteobacterium IMCC2047]|nr:hypothetical protein imdm_1685 [gamma proteobacterium IMCC2047]